MLKQQVALVEKWIADQKSVSDEELLANEWQAYQYYKQATDLRWRKLNKG